MDNPGLLSLQVYQSEAYQIYTRFQTFAGNYFVFERNYQELNKLLSAAQDPKTFLDLWIQSKIPEMVIVIRELTRLLHNFLASAKTLVEHTRALVDDWYKGTEFAEEYQKEIQKRFIGNPITGFVEDLRNYSLHFRLPFTGAIVRFVEDPTTKEFEPNQSFILPKAELMKWQNWSNKGKVYLESANEEISIQQIVDMYFQDVSSFHSWMLQRLEDIHSEDLRWLDEMAQRVDKAEEKLHANQPKAG